MFIKKYLQKNKLSNLAIAIALTSLALGTNLLNYLANESSMSHVFSFAVIACHVFLIKKYIDYPGVKILVLIGITLGLLVLIRPVNAMVVLSYPFLMNGNFLWLKEKNSMIHIAIAGLVALLVVSIQLVIWRIETGSFFVFGYKNEGFYFNELPHIFDYLFSFKRGAFIYSPVLLFSLMGLLFLWKQNKKEFLWLLFFLILVLYVHASWWSWYYGDGFGARALIDFYVFFALLIAFAFNELKNRYLKVVAIVMSMLSIGLHQVFFYQYYYSIIHADSMDFEKFAYVFLKTDKRYAGIFKCNPDDFYHPYGIQVVDSVYVDFSKNGDRMNRFLYDKKNIVQKGYNLSNDQYQPQVIFTTDSSWFNKIRFVEFYIDYLEPHSK